MDFYGGTQIFVSDGHNILLFIYRLTFLTSTNFLNTITWPLNGPAQKLKAGHLYASSHNAMVLRQGAAPRRKLYLALLQD